MWRVEMLDRVPKSRLRSYRFGPKEDGRKDSADGCIATAVGQGDQADRFRYEAQGHRLIFGVNGKKRAILIVYAGDRKDVYRHVREIPDEAWERFD